jgi:NAD(P)-dependent dehydrogenase (short-subunit alcohol dehydrogenase family)
MAIESLGGRRCFVTGAAGGIGRATALAAARQGADLYLTDIARDRYLVFTSADIRVGHWAQRFCPPLYELAMRKLNDVLVRTAQGS